MLCQAYLHDEQGHRFGEFGFSRLPVAGELVEMNKDGAVLLFKVQEVIHRMNQPDLVIVKKLKPEEAP